ncbi:toll/interleukin-1 receptor domain-containing protein [Jidongwangia harbinensis]|uniref:toll/interleukin-1 receptor domain-containing protein n=1 Tax=Jidongwangia harbinensis TaxID=2878561 RepID=UPI001CD98098|nr:toll/interleukin-1 receptor domain-containing protein [Jidongwangia harbinensis]
MPAIGHGFIFVSHSRRNRAAADALVSWLNTAGLKTWMSGPELHCPAWQREVFPRIAKCAAFAVIASPDAAIATGVMQEIVYARELNKPMFFIPLRSLTRFQANQRQQDLKGVQRFAVRRMQD